MSPSKAFPVFTGKWANLRSVPVPSGINKLHSIFPNTATFAVLHFICKRKISLPPQVSDCRFFSQIVFDHRVNLVLAQVRGLAAWKWLCLSLEKLRQRRRQSNCHRLFPNLLPASFGRAPSFQPPFPLFAEAAAYKDTNCDGGFYVNGFHVMISPTTTDPQIVGWLYWEKS